MHTVGGTVSPLSDPHMLGNKRGSSWVLPVLIKRGFARAHQAERQMSKWGFGKRSPFFGSWCDALTQAWHLVVARGECGKAATIACRTSSLARPVG
jgi:hypothetical protein